MICSTRTHLARRLGLAFFVFFSSLLPVKQVFAQDSEVEFATEQISDGIYMLYGANGFTGGNIAVSSGVDGLAVIDNGLGNLADKLVAEITEISDQPVDYLINTHVHGDHTGNNALFGAQGTRLISHRNLRTSMIEKGVGHTEEFVAPTAEALPVITFSDEMTLNLNGDALRLIHVANAHTDGDAIIWFQQANVLHTGDVVFNGLFPYIDTDNGGSLTGVLAALKQILEIANDETKIIPGHGPLASRADIVTTIAMLEDSRDLVAQLVEAGKSDEEILQINPLQKYQQYHWGFITTERMTKQMIHATRGT